MIKIGNYLNDNNLPFVKFQLSERVHLWNEWLERLRMRLEHLEESHSANRFDVGLQDEPRFAKDLLLFACQIPFRLEIKQRLLKCSAYQMAFIKFFFFSRFVM